MSMSKDVSTLENDLLELKANLSEWKSMPSLLQVEDTNNGTQAIKHISLIPHSYGIKNEEERLAHQ